MQYAYAALLLNRADEELNEQNLTAVLNAANCSVVESRVKALVAAFEGVDLDEIDADLEATVGTESDSSPESDGDTRESAVDPSGEPTSEAFDWEETASDGEPPTGD